jgi:hypothetical protein
MLENATHHFNSNKSGRNFDIMFRDVQRNAVSTPLHFKINLA